MNALWWHKGDAAQTRCGTVVRILEDEPNDAGAVLVESYLGDGYWSRWTEGSLALYPLGSPLVCDGCGAAEYCDKGGKP